MFASKCAELRKEVEFLGVFDTVAATQGSLDLNPDTYPARGVVFENSTMGDHIKKAVNSVSVDEKRITEACFAGVRSDIDGSYRFDGLSDITLEFMMDYVRDDLKIQGAQDCICWDDLNVNPLPNGVLHEQKRKGIAAKTLLPRFVRVNKKDQPSLDNLDIPIIHHSVCERFSNVASYRPYDLQNKKFFVMQKNGTVDENPEFIGVAGLK
jgi:hypothetical protein